MTHSMKALIAAGIVALSAGPVFAAAHADFDVEEARLDLTLDTNGDGEVTDDEIIDGNMALFDTNGDGVIDAEERGEAQTMIEAD